MADAAEVQASTSPLGPRGATRFLLGLLPLALGAVLFFGDFPICAAKGVLGIPCPGCGLTRSTEALLHFDWGAVWTLHPMAPVITPIVVWALLRMTLVMWGIIPEGKFDLFRMIPRWLWTVMIVLMFGLWGVRLASGTHPDPVGFEHGALTQYFF